MPRPILITGVGQRAGLHLARHFLQRGCPVIGTYRRDRPALAGLEQSGTDLYRCDFYRAGDLETLIEVVTDRYRGLRAIIHNASDWLPDDGDLCPAEVMTRMLQVHVQGPYQLNLALSPLLQADADKPADIIHVGDDVSGRGSRNHIA